MGDMTEFLDWSQVPLGSKPDGELARQYGVTGVAVLHARRRYHVPCAIPPATKPKIDWDKQPLGEIQDRVLAQRLAVHETTVAYQRKRRGLQPAGRVNWDAEPMLGRVSDRTLARKHGVSLGAVRSARAARGIQQESHKKNRPTSGKRMDWSDVPDDVVFFADAESVAEKLGVAKEAVYKARTRRRRKKGIEDSPRSGERGPIGIDWDAVPLGEMPDSHIAKEMGCSRACVTMVRRKRGIPAYTYREHAAGFVYFLLCPEAGRVKIGKAVNSKRVRSLASMNALPLELVALLRSDDAYGLEQRIHRELQESRLHGEWFRYDAGVRALIWARRDHASPEEHRAFQDAALR